MLDKILIACPTKLQAEELMSVLSDLGVKRGYNCKLEEFVSVWDKYKENTVFSLNNRYIGYDRYEFYSSNPKYFNYKFYYAENFIKEFKKNKIMTKEDLKPGMVIEYRTKTRRLLVPDYNNNLIAIGEYGYLENLDFYNEDLCSINNSDLDIIKVYSIRYPEVLPNVLNDNKNLTLLWERKEPKEYTMQEIANKLGIPVEELRIKK